MLKEKYYIPHYRIEKDVLIPVDYQGFKVALCMMLEKLSVDNFYFTKVQRYHNGSFYEEETLTVFETEDRYDIFAAFYIQTVRAYDIYTDTFKYYETGYNLVSFDVKNDKTF